MDLRRRLTLVFMILIASIIIISSVVIYFWFAEYRQDEFYTRMSRKAHSVAELLIDIDEVDVKLLRKIDNAQPIVLPDEIIIIYDRNDKIIYHNPQNSFRVNAKNLQQIRKDNRMEYTQADYEVLGLNYEGRYDDVVVVIAAHDTFGLSKLNKLRVILFIVSVSSILLVYITGVFFIGIELNPLSKLMRGIDNISASNLYERLNEGNRKGDIGKLAVTFNNMMQRLESSFHLQRIFIANASHELRTPLTVITGQLEIALIKDRSSEEYNRIIKSVLEDIVNVNDLANRLLLIAQASTDFSNIELQKIRIDDALWQARHEAKKMNPGNSVHVFFGENMDNEINLTVMGNLLLIKTAFTNLIENACKYSKDKLVRIYVDNYSQKIKLRFVDNGIGISPEEIELIFEPFYRGKNSTGVKGHGIGLALVKNIINLHKGEINVSSTPGTGTEFCIILPVYNIS